MKIGPLEILVIFLAALAAGLVVRVFRGDRGATEPIDVGSERRSDTGITPIKKIGLFLVISGAAILILGIGLFEAAFKAYFWAFVLLAVGLVVLMLSRKNG